MGRKGLFTLLLTAVLVFSAAFPSYADDPLTLVEQHYAQTESVSGWVDVPGRGPMRYYAQNDELWMELTYETEDSSKMRPFGDGGCNPTALAMAVRSLIPEGSLSVIVDDALRAYSLCTCSINRSHCGYHHPRYYITSPRDFDRFLPLVFADYACGNNRQQAKSRNEGKGTVGGYMKYVASAYGLNLKTVGDQKSGLEAIRDTKNAVIAYAASGGAFTTVGHYVFAAWADEENVYFLDPLCRDVYRTNNAKVVHILQPGLVSIRLQDLKSANINSWIILTPKESD